MTKAKAKQLAEQAANKLSPNYWETLKRLGTPGHTMPYDGPSLEYNAAEDVVYGGDDGPTKQRDVQRYLVAYGADRTYLAFYETRAEVEQSIAGCLEDNMPVWYVADLGAGGKQMGFATKVTVKWAK